MALVVFVKFKLFRAQFVYKLPVNLVLINILLGSYIVAIVYTSKHLYQAYIAYCIV